MSRKQSLKWLAGLAIAYCLGMANWLHPTVRFDSHLLNVPLFAVLTLLPWALLVGTIRLGGRWRLAAIPVALLALVSLPLVAVACLELRSAFGQGGRFARRVSTASAWPYQVGVFKSYGMKGYEEVFLRQELPIFPGVVLLHSLGGFETCRNLVGEPLKETEPQVRTGDDKVEVVCPSGYGWTNGTILRSDILDLRAELVRTQPQADTSTSSLAAYLEKQMVKPKGSLQPLAMADPREPKQIQLKRFLYF